MCYNGGKRGGCPARRTRRRDTAEWTRILKDAACVKKYPKPILTKNDFPYEAGFIFNAGVAKVGGKYVMVFRDDCGATEAEYFAATTVDALCADKP